MTHLTCNIWMNKKETRAPTAGWKEDKIINVQYELLPNKNYIV